jgi:hypothetical protein
MSVNWGSAAPDLNRETEKHAKWMIRGWFLITVAALLFIDFGGRL